MSYRRLAAVSLICLWGSPCWSDTITTTDHLSVNGELKNMSNGEITLVAYFSSGTRIIDVKIAAVAIIEFNSTTANSGAPPAKIGISPSPENSNVVEEEKDTIVMRGGLRQSCDLLSIDKDSVHCKGSKESYKRRSVIRIVMGAK